jgi:hypothetical protein
MTLTPRHEEVEAGFRALLESADVTAPDAVGYEPDAVVFYWHESKLVVFVDFDADEAGEDCTFFKLFSRDNV